MSVELLHIDCMKYMKEKRENSFDLALVDPPYGILRSETFGGKNWKGYEKKYWDRKQPYPQYFTELFRVSKNQIIWGANYFTKNLHASMGWIFWDKGQELTMSDGELAFSSFDRALRKVTINRCKISEYGGFMHPTQKPVKLYKWLLKNYAKPGDKILDTHLGSGSSAIAAHQMGFDFVGCEIDKDYFDAAMKRFKEQTMQINIW